MLATMADAAPDMLWTPDPDRPSAMADFRAHVRERHGIDAGDYAALQRWSVDDLDGFWSSAAEFLGVRWHDRPTATLGSRWKSASTRGSTAATSTAALDACWLVSR